MNREFLKAICLALFCLLCAMPQGRAAEYRQALPGYKYSFPYDHGSHDDFKTEWWYCTGHLTGESRSRYGFELTFFRTASGDPAEEAAKKIGRAWTTRNLYLAHFALTDIDGGSFRYFEKLNRPGLGLASAEKGDGYVFNERWSMEFLGDTLVLRADEKDISLHLALRSKKAPVIHGVNGISQKAEGEGRASHYYSLTRLTGSGRLSVKGKSERVQAVAWMDHEFGSNQLQEDQVGWDWFSIQLDSGKELMLYVMRRKDGTIDRHSSGTIVFADGRSRHLQRREFRIEATDYWQSPISKGKYPIAWRIDIPSQKLKLTVVPPLKGQELVTGKSTGVTYWEGCVDVDGSVDGAPDRGRGYVEMTGYAERFKKKI